MTPTHERMQELADEAISELSSLIELFAHNMQPRQERAWRARLHDLTTRFALNMEAED